MDWLFTFITIIVGAWFIVAEAVLLYFALRYRRKEGRRAAYLPARTLPAMAFVLVPCALILGFDLIIDGVAAPIWRNVKQTIPPRDELVRITGHQWVWRFAYAGPDGKLGTPDDVTEAPALHVPVGEVVEFELTAKDVIHSFFVPELRLKQDAVPGRTIRGWFEVTRPGTFEIACAELCGFGHTLMKGTLVAEAPETYRQWLEAQSAAAKGSQ
jgi:cytochrome c oxidase subunit 2